MSAEHPLSSGARAILNAATELFAKDGFEAVSVGAIAELAGVSKSNVFHHFISKEELFLAVMREVGAPHAEFAEGLLVESGASVDKLRRLIAFEIADLLDNLPKMQLVLRELADYTHGGCDFARQVFLRNFRAVVALIEQGQQRGEFNPAIDAAVAALMLGGAKFLFLQAGYIARQLPGVKPLRKPELYADEIFKILLNGVIDPGESPPLPRRPPRQSRHDAH
jgi:TetR/AcrR family transcriptional regulator